jgi:hypothetical protein
VDARVAVGHAGVTNAVLQLGAAAGVAIVGAIFFSLLSSRDFAAAAGSTLWYNAGVLVLAVLLTPFLPRAAQSPKNTPEPAPEPDRMVTF